MTASSHEDELRQDIGRTREQLGETVEALAHKADVPARVRGKVHEPSKLCKSRPTGHAAPTGGHRSTSSQGRRDGVRPNA